MPAPKGNEFWKMRSPRKFSELMQSATLLETAACEYFEWCTGNPLTNIVLRGKDNTPVEVVRVRPFSMAGFCSYTGINRTTLHYHTEMFRKRTDAEGQALFATINWIQNVIYEQKFSGVAAGLMHPAVIAKDY